MGHVQYPDTLRKFVAEMATLERQIEEALDQWMPEVQGHVEAAEVIKQFQTIVKGQREAMEACLVGTHDSGSGSAITNAPTAAPSGVPIDMAPVLYMGGPHAGSNALHAMTRAFNRAVFGYAMLHTVAHRFNDFTGEKSAAGLAEHHQLCYIEASQAVYRLIPDVVIQEMGKNGECVCTCPACSLGICLCWHAHVASYIPVSPADEAGILVRSPKSGSAAFGGGLQQGDVILAVDGQLVQTYQELQAEIRKHGPGDDIRLQTLREPEGPQEITVAFPS